MGPYNSPVFETSLSWAANTVASGRRIKTCWRRASFMLLVGLQVPVLGSYNSADLPALLSVPPDTSTLPSPSSTAAAWARPTVMVPVADQVPWAGSYRSADAGEMSPPATNTRPLLSNV